MRFAVFYFWASLLALASWAGNGQLGDLSLPTGFTYSGELQQAGLPAEGSFDFEFVVFGTREGSTSLGSTVRYEVPVTEGSFKTELDFGTPVFGPEARWLEIAVRPAGEVNFTPLRPRQLLQEKAGVCAVTSDLIVDGGRVGVGTTAPESPLHILANPSVPQIRLEDTQGFWTIWGGDNFHLDNGALPRLRIVGNSGNIGIGLDSNIDSKLKVGGRIHSTTSGFRFPDNTTQTTKAALQSVYQNECWSVQIPYTSKTSSCECAAGDMPLGGGWDSVRVDSQPGGGSHSREVFAYYNRPVAGGWEVGIRNDDLYPHDVVVFVNCGGLQP